MTNYSAPSPTIPPFLFNKIANKFVAELIRWAKREYEVTVTELYLNSQTTKAKYLEQNHSYLDFLARSAGFRQVLKYMTSEVWSGLDRKTQDALIRAKEVVGA